MNFAESFSSFIENPVPGIITGLLTAIVLKGLEIAWSKSKLLSKSVSDRQKAKTAALRSRLFAMKRHGTLSRHFMIQFMSIGTWGFIAIVGSMVANLAQGAVKDRYLSPEYFDFWVFATGIPFLIIATIIGFILFLTGMQRVRRDIEALNYLDNVEAEVRAELTEKNAFFRNYQD